MAHVSLYRRYRPGRFSALRGQDHIVRALVHAVETGTQSHAYLFSGPRGTGKTSTARILAKALNCTNLSGGEPCGECESCKAVEAGSSYDLFELDAASNNGVDAMRELIGRTAVGSPGRTKVYILDEVHMLSPAASNALLKTLEEPPDHVTFVLATTDPQKVLPTIRSRTQHFEFRLLTAAELTDYVRWVVDDAGLTLDDTSIAQVVRQGRGSARDTLSALDLAVAAGGLTDRVEPIEGILDAMAQREVAGAVVAVADAMGQGREPRVLAEALVATLRDAFLLAVGADSSLLSDLDRERLGALGSRLGTPMLTRALETLGAALVDMRQASDPRVPLEVALIRLCDPTLDASVASLVERIERLERGGGGRPSLPPPGDQAGSTPHADAVDAADSPAAGPPGRRAAPPTRPAPERRDTVRQAPPARPAPPRPTPAPPAAPPGARPSDAATPERAAGPMPDREPTGQQRPSPAESPAPSESPAAPPPAGSTSASPKAEPGGFPTRDELALAMGDSVLGSLRGIAKAIYSTGRFVSVDGGTAVFALANEATRQRAERVRADVEAALAAHFGRPVPLTLVDEAAAGSERPAPDRPAAARPAADPSAPTASPPPRSGGATEPETGAEPRQPDPRSVPEDAEDDAIDLADVADLEDAPNATTSGVDRLVQAFPGAVVVEQEDP